MFHQTVFGGVRVTVLLASSLLAAAVTTPAQAASATWSPESILATELPFAEFPGRVTADVNTAGRSVVAWEKPLPSGGGFGIGPLQVWASVRSTATGAWSVATPLSPNTGFARNAGTVVDPASGKVTVAWTRGGSPFVSSSSDGGGTWLTEPVPTAAGYDFVVNTRPFDTDAKGNITFILMKQNPSGATYDVQSIVKTARGIWRPPTTMTGAAGIAFTGSTSFNVISDGRALLGFGYSTFRRNSSGTWGSAQSINLAGLDLADQTSADIDANGRGYYLIHAFVSGVPGIYLSTSGQAGGWSTPRHMPALDVLSFGVRVTGSSSGRAMISGSDNTATMRATVTRDGGSTWGTLANFGRGGIQSNAVGSENGLYAISWSGSATGTGASLVAGSGSGSIPWVQTSLGSLAQSPPPAIAIAGKPDASNAKSVAGWQSQVNATTFSYVISGSLGTIGR